RSPAGAGGRDAALPCLRCGWSRCTRASAGLGRRSWNHSPGGFVMRAWMRVLPMLALCGLVGGWMGTGEGQIVGLKAPVSRAEGKSIDEAQQEAYDGPKARVAVSQFKDKTGKGWWTGAIGDGMADMLSTALFHSNRYIVLERQQVSDVLREQDLGASGRVQKGTEAPIG